MTLRKQDNIDFRHVRCATLLRPLIKKICTSILVNFYGYEIEKKKGMIDIQSSTMLVTNGQQRRFQREKYLQNHFLKFIQQFYSCPSGDCVFSFHTETT